MLLRCNDDGHVFAGTGIGQELVCAPTHAQTITHYLVTFAGASFGQELPPKRMEALICAAGRIPRQRTTLYGEPPAERLGLALQAPPLQPLRSPVASL